MSQKYLYCPQCKNYPDRILDTYDWLCEERVWNTDCYTLENSGVGQCIEECAVCNHRLEDKPQEEINGQ